MATEAEVFEASLKDCMAFNQTYNHHFGRSSLLDSPNSLFLGDIANSLSSFCLNGTPEADLFHFESDIYGLNILTPCSNTTSGDDLHLVFIAIPLSQDNIFQWLGIVCEPSYSLSRRKVFTTASLSSVFQLRSVSENASEPLQLGISPVKLTTMFNEKLHIAAVGSSMLNPERSNELLLCLNITSPKPRPSDFANLDTLHNAFEKFFRSTMALHVKSHYSVPSNLTTTGTLTSATTRLFVGEWSLRFMEGFLGLLFVLSILLIFYKCPIFPQDPAPLAVQTIFLAQNPYLESVLRKFSNDSHEWLLPRNSLHCSAEDRLRTSQSLPNATLSASSYESSHINTNSSNATTECFHRAEGWRQMTASWGYRVAVLACTVLLVVSLEILFYISTNNKSHADMPSPSSEIYAWNYLPSLVMASISILYSSLDCTARILHPFQKLNKGNVAFKELFWEPLGASTIKAIVQSAEWHHFALTMILLTSLLAPTLTIITSGLFTTSAIPYQGQTSFSALDWFSIQTLYSSGIPSPTSRGQFVSNSIEFGNLSFPQWTHEDLLFPKIMLDIDHDKGVQGLGYSMTARLPSIRPQMNCTFRGIWDQAPYNVGTFSFSIPSLPEYLDRGPTTEFYIWDTDIMRNTTYIAASLLSSEDDLIISSTEIGYNTPTHRWFAVARVGHDVLEDVFLIQCTSYIESLHTVVNFTLPNYTIDLSEGNPQPDEADSERHVLTNTDIPMLGILALFDDNPSNRGIDGFFTTVVYGKDGPPIEDLLGRANADRLVRRMEHVYARIVV